MYESTNQLRWGILGCGDVAEHKGGPPLYTVDGSTLTAVMRRDQEKVEAFARRHGTRRTYHTVEALLTDDEINAIYIATPPYLHCEQTILAAQAGKHVLCEKPMGMNVAECRQMIDACREHNVTLMIAYYRPFFPNVVKMKQLMEEGAIGEVVLARVNHTASYDPSHHEWGAWRTNPRISGGGVLMDLGSHRIDLLLYLLGDVASACGYAETVCFDYPVDDSAVFTLRFENGTHAVANLNWSVGVSVDEVEVYGTKGSLRCNPLNSGNLTLQTKEKSESFDQKPLPYTHTGLIEDFVNHVRTGAPIRCSGEQGLKTNTIIADIYENRRS
ncbi:MAG: Gfo/Idh/MocA family oxidoreductase [Candidatus Poribacteria bacterium]|nr:Gfo/Idh/MocA family oxidoreductase [Candidatus Poribacteria bacterium]